MSPPHKKSCGQEYRVYPDWIELHARIRFRTLRIPFDRIVQLEVRTENDWTDLFRRPLEFWWTYNNDWAGLPHVFLKQRGWPSRIRFAPQDPAAFVAKCCELGAFQTPD